MADTCTQYTFGSLTVNPSSGANGLYTDFAEGGISGLDGAPIRKQVQDKGITEGATVFPAFFGARIIQFSGMVVITTTGLDETAYAAAVNVVEAAAVSALEAQLNSATNLAWTPTGGSGKTISCTYGVPGGEIQFSGNMASRKFQFSLIAADPTIS